MTVTGSPQLALTIGTQTRQATYDQDLGTSLVFTYKVQAGDMDADGISIAANALTLNGGTVIATDTDESDTSVSYTLAGGADAGKFDIDGTTGMLTFQTAPDYETPGSAAGTNDYTVRVQVTSGTGTRVQTADQTITVTVTNVNEAPKITSGATFSVAENTTMVTTVTATDEDTSDRVTLTLNGGADAATFTIDSTTGVLTFNAPPNHEAPTDTGTDNIYEVVVRATDSSLYADQTLTVTVTDMDETDATLRTLTLADGAGPPVSIGAFDAATLSYTASVGAGVSSVTITAVDNSEDAADKTVTVSATATNSVGITAPDSQTLTILDDEGTPTVTIANAPVVTEGTNAQFTVTVSPPSTSAVTVDYTVASVGTDTAAAADYTGTTTGSLTIPADTATGTLSVAMTDDAVDEPDAETFTVTLTAVSTGASLGTTTTATGTIDDNDAPPVVSIAITDDEATVNEGDPDLTVEATVSLSTASGKTVTVDWRTAADTATADEDYTAVPDTLWTFPPGQTRQTVQVDILDDGTYEDPETFTIELVSPANTTLHTTDTRVEVTITSDDAAPNAPPTFTSAATFTVAENTTMVGTVEADDADAADDVTGYALQGGADMALFRLTPAGVLTFAAGPDHEQPTDTGSDNTYEVVVRATSGTGGRVLTADQTIRVEVTDVAEDDADLSGLSISPGRLTETFAADTTSYTASVGTSVGSVRVTPTAHHPDATIRVDGTIVVTSGEASAPLSLRAGSTTITIEVTAEDGLTTQEYTIAVTRAATPGGGGGGGGGGVQRPPADQHGDTHDTATVLDPTASTAGYLQSRADVDYFQVALPYGGVLSATTTGSTDTHGQLWQAQSGATQALRAAAAPGAPPGPLQRAQSGHTLTLVAEDTDSGPQRNFQLGEAVAAGTYYLAMSAGASGSGGAYTLAVQYSAAQFENPQPDSPQSGTGVLSGWVYDADSVESEFARPSGSVWQVPAATGTLRTDTAGVCGDSDNGLGLLWNWNKLGPGTHTVRAVVDGIVARAHPDRHDPGLRRVPARPERGI